MTPNESFNLLSKENKELVERTIKRLLYEQQKPTNDHRYDYIIMISRLLENSTLETLNFIFTLVTKLNREKV